MKIVLYMEKGLDSSQFLPGGILTQGRYSVIIRESFDYRSTENRLIPEIGERLYCSEVIEGGIRRSLPTKWVVTGIETFTADYVLADIEGITIAWCEAKVLPTEEFKALIKDIPLGTAPALEGEEDE